jgi:putative ABC transport system permease protein
MEILPILRSLRRNRVGAVLIGLQITLTLAIVCNCVSIIQQHLQQMRRPSGIDEANIFSFWNGWLGDPTDPAARVQGDLAALRALPGVIDAVATNSFPLHGGGSSWDLSIKPEKNHRKATSALYYVDQHALAAYGLKLTAGRWFRADEVGELRTDEDKFPATIVITQHLAEQLFPAGNALGRLVYFTTKEDIQGAQASLIVGIIQTAQTPFAGSSWGESFLENSTFVPFQYLDKSGVVYVVRTRAGQQATVMRIAQDKLYGLRNRRVIQALRQFSFIRHQAYLGERATSVMLEAVCALLLTITAFGVIGLTMYWVNQRRRYIGMRRALGARRLDILKYFHTENLLIAGTGCALGIALGLWGNAWLAVSLELTRMSAAFIGGGALMVLGLCQAAVLWPALRAASIPPALATRAM